MKTRREFIALASGCILPVVLTSCIDDNPITSYSEEGFTEAKDDGSTAVQMSRFGVPITTAAQFL